MKFNCGETKVERETRLSGWHDHFIMIPRRVGKGDCRWLETIERRGKYKNEGTGSYWVWEYRAKVRDDMYPANPPAALTLCWLVLLVLFGLGL